MHRAIIVDDEAGGRETLELLLESHFKEQVQVAGVAASVQEAKALIDQEKPDILFLDVELSPGNGFDLLEAIDPIDFEVIFITAYDQFAIKAIKYVALDYLLKPVDVEELGEAIARVGQRKPKQDYKELLAYLGQAQKKEKSFSRISLPTDKGTLFVDAGQVIRCEARNNYTMFYFSNQSKLLVSKTLKEYEKLLSGLQFIRVHQSHIINLDHIRQYLKNDGGYLEMTDGSSIPIARRKKKQLLELIGLS